MEFNTEYKPNRDNLAPRMVEMMDRVFYSRRAQGMNVQFIREDGRLDEFSLESPERAQDFLEKCQRQGLDAVISHA